MTDLDVIAGGCGRVHLPGTCRAVIIGAFYRPLGSKIPPALLDVFSHTHTRFRVSCKVLTPKSVILQARGAAATR